VRSTSPILRDALDSQLQATHPTLESTLSVLVFNDCRYIMISVTLRAKNEAMLRSSIKKSRSPSLLLCEEHLSHCQVKASRPEGSVWGLSLCAWSFNYSTTQEWAGDCTRKSGQETAQERVIQRDPAGHRHDQWKCERSRRASGDRRGRARQMRGDNGRKVRVLKALNLWRLGGIGTVSGTVWVEAKRKHTVCESHRT
jgi:hypothetical protein